MSQSEFQRKFSRQERPFAAGSARGVRAWSTPVRRTGDDPFAQALLYKAPPLASEPTGVLTGQKGGKWTTGENVAECLKEGEIALMGLNFTFDPRTGRLEIAEKPEPCDLLAPDCSCGFYGYWSVDDASIGDDCNIIGVVEAYGKVTVTLAEAIEKVREQYPDVAVFANTRAMLAEFPPDEAPEIEDEPALDSILANAMQQVRQGGMVYAPSPFTSSMAGLSLSFNTSSIHPPLANSGARQSLSHLFVDELLEPRDPWWIRHLPTIVAVGWALATGFVAWLIGGA